MFTMFLQSLLHSCCALLSHCRRWSGVKFKDPQAVL